MDKEEKGRKQRFDWLPMAMPSVARMVAERRKLVGDAHVNECWTRGVVKGEPGWFFAREGALAVGVPWRAEDMTPTPVPGVPHYPGQALLILRDVEHA